MKPSLLFSNFVDWVYAFGVDLHVFHRALNDKMSVYFHTKKRKYGKMVDKHKKSLNITILPYWDHVHNKSKQNENSK